MIDIRQSKYLNNIVEQDHWFIKRKIRPMMGFKAFNSASATLQGIEIAHMVGKGQIGSKGQSAFDVFAKPLPTGAGRISDVKYNALRNCAVRR